VCSNGGGPIDFFLFGSINAITRSGHCRNVCSFDREIRLSLSLSLTPGLLHWLANLEEHTCGLGRNMNLPLSFHWAIIITKSDMQLHCELIY